MNTGLSVLPERLRTARLLRELTQQQLAVRAGVGQSQVSKLERGESADPSFFTVAALAGALNISLDALAGPDSDELLRILNNRPSAESGIVIGRRFATGDPLVFDRFAAGAANPNLFVHGASGSDRSHVVQIEALRARQQRRQTVFVDPHGDFTTTTERLGGRVVSRGVPFPTDAAIVCIDLSSVDRKLLPDAMKEALELFSSNTAEVEQMTVVIDEAQVLMRDTPRELLRFLCKARFEGYGVTLASPSLGVFWWTEDGGVNHLGRSILGACASHALLRLEPAEVAPAVELFELAEEQATRLCTLTAGEGLFVEHYSGVRDWFTVRGLLNASEHELINS